MSDIKVNELDLEAIAQELAEKTNNSTLHQVIDTVLFIADTISGLPEQLEISPDNVLVASTDTLNPSFDQLYSILKTAYNSDEEALQDIELFFGAIAGIFNAVEAAGYVILGIQQTPDGQVAIALGQIAPQDDAETTTEA